MKKNIIKIKFKIQKKKFEIYNKDLLNQKNNTINKYQSKMKSIKILKNNKGKFKD